MLKISVPATAAFVSLLLFAAPSPAQDDNPLTPPAARPTAQTATPAPAPAPVQATATTAAPAPVQTMVDTPAPAPGASRVRIVRLSEVRGTVEVNRGTSNGFESAMNNLPIVERSEVRTGTGIAEIEFEDNSTLRLAPDSVVAFPILERLGTGATVSEAQLLKGSAYVSIPKGASNGLTLLFGPTSKLQKVELSAGSHIRLNTDADEAQLAVYSGPVHLSSRDGDMELPARRSVTVSLVSTAQPEVTKQIATSSFDSWDKQSTDYHSRVATLSALGNSPYAYGTNDLSYYGSFVNGCGGGMMWRPYFTSASWDPYANGAWAWYPNAGYSWVSPYPWGWMPYHSGSWAFCPGMGWGWMPGGGWNGLMNSPGIAATGGGTGIGFKGIQHPPIHPPTHPPAPRQPTLMQVNMKPLVTSDMGKNNSFLFRRDSAGLGIPREGLGKLDGFSHSALQHGVASTPVYTSVGPAPGFGPRGGERMAGGSNLAPVEIHRGYAPPAMSTSRSADSGWAGRSGMGGASAGSGSAPAMSSAPSAPSSVSRGSMGGGGGVGGGGGASPSGGARPH
ncbi:MAG TPA: FecR family protein [Acidobacteriaceae bacterium]|nr:FecR family protein [Acidobacteriaceae bacterium]